MARKPPKGKSLAEVNPELAKQWHTSKNGDLSPSDVFPSSSKKVWWKCDKGNDHEWESSLNNMSNGRGCPICSGKKVVQSNSLATLNLALAKEWHKTKNGDLNPALVTPSSNKKVWWKCDKGDDHVWKTSISHRNNGTDCPFCSGRKASKINCLANLNPKLALEWHPTKNNDLTPADVTEFSGNKVWWKCDKGDDHEWTQSVSNRTKGSGCPVCSGYKLVESNSLSVINPKLAKEWHSNRNGDFTAKDTIAGSKKKVWWKCDKGDDHEWEATIDQRIRGRGCPICRGLKVVKSNSLATLNPKLANEWHPTKNGDLNPSNVPIKTVRKVWWKCDKGFDHEWVASISNRSNGVNCPICSGHEVVKSNSLATLNPKLALEWHPTKNNDLTPNDVTEYSGKKVWWKCNKGTGHEWNTYIGNRSGSRMDGCPFCTLTPQSRQELIITFELIQFFRGINPRGYKASISGKIRSLDIYIPTLNLGIEFDGTYFHKDKVAKDKLKTLQFKKEGFDIFRVRQQSKKDKLKKLTKNDVISKYPYNGKEVVNNVLKQIIKMYELDTKKVAKIESYIAKKELQNEKGLDKYIEMILTEKAAKKP